VETGRLVHTLEGKPINEAIVYSPDGSLLVGPLDSHTLNVWDAESGRVVHTLDTKQDIIRDAAFRPDGARLAVVGDGGLVTIWSVPGWEPLQSLRVSEQHAMRCRYSRDGKSLATLGLNWIKIWDGATGEYRFLIRGAGSDLSYTPDGGRIAASGDGGTVRFWDAKQEQGAFVHNAKTNLYDASFSGDGRRIIDASGSILDAVTGAVVRSLPTPSGETMSDAVLFPDSRRAIFFRYKSDPPSGRITTGDLFLWDVETGREIKHLTPFQFPHCLEISPDGRWLLALVKRENDDTYTQSELTLRDATTWEPVYTRKEPAVYGRHAVFSSDSKSILLGTKDHVTLVEAPSGRELKTYGPLPYEPLAVALSPDGRWVAAAPSVNNPAGGTVHIWDSASGVETRVIPQTAGEIITTLSFSPDGRRLATAGFDAKIKIWDTESSLELLTLNGHTSWIWNTHFSPDGRRILSCGRDKTLRLWDASPLGADAAH
jgi:WD40 repeat protein